MSQEKKTAKQFFDEESNHQYKASPGFHAKFDSIARIPFVVLPAVYKVMDEYADQRLVAFKEQLKKRLKDDGLENLIDLEKLNSVIDSEEDRQHK